MTPTAANALAEHVDQVLWPGVVLAVLLVALAAGYAARSSLRTVERNRSQAAAIDGADSAKPIDVSGGDAELTDPADTVNGMIGRLERARDVQSRFAADAAHELRTPIGSLVAALEIAERYPDAIDQKEALHHALAEAHRVSDLASDLLSTIGRDAGQTRSEAVAIDIVVDAARFLPRDRLCLFRSIAPAIVRVDPLRRGRAIGNVLRNADRHAFKMVEITGRAEEDSYVLLISNDGEAIPDFETPDASSSRPVALSTPLRHRTGLPSF